MKRNILDHVISHESGKKYVNFINLQKLILCFLMNEQNKCCFENYQLHMCSLSHKLAAREMQRLTSLTHKCYTFA